MLANVLTCQSGQEKGWQRLSNADCVPTLVQPCADLVPIFKGHTQPVLDLSGLGLVDPLVPVATDATVSALSGNITLEYLIVPTDLVAKGKPTRTKRRKKEIL